MEKKPAGVSQEENQRFSLWDIDNRGRFSRIVPQQRFHLANPCHSPWMRKDFSMDDDQPLLAIAWVGRDFRHEADC